jgi:hypothetical protein
MAWSRIKALALTWYVLAVAAGLVTWLCMRADSLINKEERKTSSYVKNVALASAVVGAIAFALQRYQSGGGASSGSMFGGGVPEEVYLTRPDF